MIAQALWYYSGTISTMDTDLPIGVLDSGIGGLTVVKEIKKFLPLENIIYVGDTLRVPYGNRSQSEITSFAMQLTTFLLKRKVKALVIACNTIDATCAEEIVRLTTIPRTRCYFSDYSRSNC
ncbi:MAG: hypothetical protein ACRDFB_01190 [Rhabdochlamydiaceae bacterium]